MIKNINIIALCFSVIFSLISFNKESFAIPVGHASHPQHTSHAQHMGHFHHHMGH